MLKLGAFIVLFFWIWCQQLASNKLWQVGLYCYRCHVSSMKCCKSFRAEGYLCFCTILKFSCSTIWGLLCHFFFFSKCGDQAELQSSQFTPPQPPNFFFTTELCCWNMYTMWFFLLKSARAFMKRNMGAHVSLKALFIVQPWWRFARCLGYPCCVH